MALAQRVAAYPDEAFPAHLKRAADAFVSPSVPVSAALPYHRLIVCDPARHWYKTIRDRLKDLCGLEKGWDGYSAEPVAFDTANFALRMLEAVCGSEAPSPSIIPGPNGDLQVEWHLDGTDIELHVRGPNDVRAWRASASTSEDGEEISLTTDFIVVAGWIKDLVELTGAVKATTA